MQIEMLLKTWFPHVTADTSKQTTTPRFTPHWRQSQLHIPVKVSFCLDVSNMIVVLQVCINQTVAKKCRNSKVKRKAKAVYWF